MGPRFGARTRAARFAAAGLTALLLGAVARPAAASAAVAPRFSLSASGPSGRPPAAAFSLARSGQQAATSVTAPAAAPLRPNYRRAIVQLGLFGVVSTYIYWKQYHEWIEDWQFELTFADQYRRFLTTEAINFDSNAYLTNWIHVVGGALYYQMARTNRLTWAESWLACLLSSSFYEWVTEWREVISINDMVFTTFGGHSVGEPWFQLSDYFFHQKRLPLRALGLMNPLNEMNHYLDRKKPAGRDYVPPGWIELVLSAGAWRSTLTGRAARDAAILSFESRIIRTPEYGRPGTFTRIQRDTSLSELAFTVALRSRGPDDAALLAGPKDEMDFYSRVVGLSWYRQSIDELGRGSALSIGLGSALTYLHKRPVSYDVRGAPVHVVPPPERPTGFTDKMTVAHLFGPVVDYTIFGRGIKVRAVADAYFDFAMTGATAMNAYSVAHAIDNMKTTLSYYGYYYGYGGSASARVDVDWGRLWVRGLASGHAWGSFQGRDRFQSSITNNAAAADTRTRYLFTAGWRFGAAPVRLFAGIEGIRRSGRVAEVKAATRETRTFAGLSFLF